MMLAPSFLKELEHLTAPWQSAFSSSKVISTSVAGAHLFALLIGGGFAVAADRSTLRALRADLVERTRQLGELHDIHRPVLISLAVLFATGVLLTLSDVATFAASPSFWIKMVLVVLLVMNGGWLVRTEQALRGPGAHAEVAHRQLWTRLRLISWASLFLWSATLLVSVVLQNAS